MTDTLTEARQHLARIRAQLADAETVLARIRANGDPTLAEKEASTRQQIEALSVQAEAMAQQLGVDPPRVLH
jgi:protein-disulfide isomerase-like protein with CxxC motif